MMRISCLLWLETCKDGSLFKTVTSAVTDSVSELRVRIFGTNKDQASVELDSVSHDIGCLYSV